MRQSAGVRRGHGAAQPVAGWVIKYGCTFAWPVQVEAWQYGIRVAPGSFMLLLFLFTVWAVLLIAVCAVCAAGGRADEGRDRWYAELQKQKEGSDKTGKDAA